MIREVRVFPDLEALSRAAAEVFGMICRETVALRGACAVALSGGSTPARLYEILASPPVRDRVPWDAVHFFWADERCVPPEHPASNFRLVRTLLLEKVPVPDRNIHRIRGEEGPERAAEACEAEMRQLFAPDTVPAFDLIFLGVGADGHTASLFPGSAALAETRRVVVPVVLAAGQISRVSMTLPVLNHARKVFFLVSGASKRAVLRDILEQGSSTGYPAAMVKPSTGYLHWYVDREAAGSEGFEVRCGQ